MTHEGSTPRARSRRWRVCLAASTTGIIRVAGSACAALLLAACSSSPPPAELPSLATIPSDAEAAARRIIPPTTSPAQGVASFQSIDLSLHESPDAAWALVDETAIPALTRGVWNANGLRIGLLPRAKVDAFVRRLPPAQGISRAQLLGSELPSPILQTPRLTGYATIDLTIPPMAVNEIEITGGRLQLLGRLTRDRHGTLVLDLLPHHHVPKVTLQPRSPLEKQLDGHIFDQLTLRVEIPPTQMLVVGLYRPWPTSTDAPPSPETPVQGEPLAPQAAEGPMPASPAPSDEAPAESGLRADESGRVLIPESPESVAPAAGQPPALPNHLGRAFFTTTRLRRELQTIMLVTIAPLNDLVDTPRYAPPPTEPVPR